MNLPNKITLSRIFLIPVFIVVFYLTMIPGNYFIALALYFIAASTDFLDGYIARKQHLVTNLGKFLDPIADKVLVSSALILIVEYVSRMFGGWLTIAMSVCVIVILARELIISGFRMVAAGQNVVLAADNLGKIKTFFTDGAIVAVFFTFGLIALDISLGAVLLKTGGIAVIIISALLTVVSGINYIVKNRDVLKEKDKNHADE